GAVESASTVGRDGRAEGTGKGRVIASPSVVVTPDRARPAGCVPSGGPSDYRDGMPDARRIGLTALGFVAAMLVTVGLVRLDPASEIPGLEQAAPREIPVAVVGEAPDAKILRDALNGPSDHPLAARLAASLEIADRRLRDREVSGVGGMGPDGHHTLRVAGAGGAAEAQKGPGEATSIRASS